MTSFVLGMNLAVTTGKIIYQNELIQLILYQSTTKKIYENPLFIIPPWINKYYIFDLQQENSFVKWLVDKGHSVFIISWVNPSSDYKDKTFSNYLLDGIMASLSIIESLIGRNKINLLGYCIGGTLLACVLAYLAQTKKSSHILSATFLTTMLDFSYPGELGIFIDDEQITRLEAHMDKIGYLDGNILAFVFSVLRANELLSLASISQFEKVEKLQTQDFLYWNADSTNIPRLTHSFYLRNMYLNNLLIYPGKIKINNVPLDLSKVKVPTYFLAARDDHIVPWKSCYKSQLFLKNTKKFILVKSGHVSGVINSPHRKKYGYWTNLSSHHSADEFLAEATFHEGSWWPDWQKWLKKYSGKLINYNPLLMQNSIESAPGSYVKVRLDNI